MILPALRLCVLSAFEHPKTCYHEHGWEENLKSLTYQTILINDPSLLQASPKVQWEAMKLVKTLAIMANVSFKSRAFHLSRPCNVHTL